MVAYNMPPATSGQTNLGVILNEIKINYRVLLEQTTHLELEEFYTDCKLICTNDLYDIWLPFQYNKQLYLQNRRRIIHPVCDA